MAKHYYKDIILELHQDVYEPREDSELLAGVIEMELGTKKSINFLDVGCGTGLISIVAAKLGANVTAVDINPKAVDLTKRNAALNGVKIKCFKSDLMKRVKGKFNIVAFNAPYLPEKQTAGSESWAAGRDLEVIRKFAAGLKKVLKPQGKAFVVISSLTSVENVGAIFRKAGFSTAEVEKKKVPWETIFVLRMGRFRRHAFDSGLI